MRSRSPVANWAPGGSGEGRDLGWSNSSWEREDKYDVGPGWALPDLTDLLPTGGRFEIAEFAIDNTYFDTPSGHLTQLGVTLRRRVRPTLAAAKGHPELGQMSRRGVEVRVVEGELRDLESTARRQQIGEIGQRPARTHVVLVFSFQLLFDHPRSRPSPDPPGAQLATGERLRTRESQHTAANPAHTGLGSGGVEVGQIIRR